MKIDERREERSWKKKYSLEELRKQRELLLEFLGHVGVRHGAPAQYIQDGLFTFFVDERPPKDFLVLILNRGASPEQC